MKMTKDTLELSLKAIARIKQLQEAIDNINNALNGQGIRLSLKLYSISQGSEYSCASDVLEKLNNEMQEKITKSIVAHLTDDMTKLQEKLRELNIDWS